jgi:diadenosine tetraphosphate (Ap4A) HIT family hydrolase
MDFTIIAGKAMKAAMKKIGVNIKRINYQENGNWNPTLHVHLYCRAENAKYQKFKDPIIPGHKEHYQKLNEDDIKRIKEEIIKLI